MTSHRCIVACEYLSCIEKLQCSVTCSLSPMLIVHVTAGVYHKPAKHHLPETTCLLAAMGAQRADWNMSERPVRSRGAALPARHQDMAALHLIWALGRLIAPDSWVSAPPGILHCWGDLCIGAAWVHVLPEQMHAIRQW